MQMHIMEAINSSKFSVMWRRRRRGIGQHHDLTWCAYLPKMKGYLSALYQWVVLLYVRSFMLMIPIETLSKVRWRYKSLVYN